MKYIFTTLFLLTIAFSAFGQEVTPTTPNKGKEDATTKAKEKDSKKAKTNKAGDSNKDAKTNTKADEVKKPCPDLPTLTDTNRNGKWRIDWRETGTPEPNNAKNGTLHDLDTFGLFVGPGILGQIFDPNKLGEGGENENEMKEFITSTIWGLSAPTRRGANYFGHTEADITFEYKSDNGELWVVQFKATGLAGKAPPSGAKKMKVECIAAQRFR